MDDASTPERDELARLKREIVWAEATLQALRAAIKDARAELASTELRQVKLENARLREENSVASEQLDTANAALEEAVKAAETDSLTRLPNRAGLWDRLRHDLAIAKRKRTTLAVVFIDLNDFKKTNDALGHEVGDWLLQRVAADLTASVRASDTVCRLGGDEFVIVMPDVRLDALQMILKKAHDAIAAPRLLQGRAVNCSASMGVSLYPDDGDEPETLVSQADHAMYRAKQDR